jgi:hypothetical protein
VQRKVVTPRDFYDLIDVEDRLLAFQDLDNAAARPFTWRYTTTDPQRCAHPHRRPRTTNTSDGSRTTPDESTIKTAQCPNREEHLFPYDGRMPAPTPGRVVCGGRRDGVPA